MDLQISRIEGREVLDSRGNPTVAVEVGLAAYQSAAPAVAL